MATRERNESQIQTDITIYGATSFVARHVLNYLADVSPSLPRKLKVTLAGRNESKLQTLLEKFAPIMESKGSSIIVLDVLVANSTDQEALNSMATRTRVVLNCAGPFALYSNGVVCGCAATGCDYVDITGEVGWVGAMRLQHGAAAAKSGARLISLCGFDSVPSDLAIFAAIQELKSASVSQGPQNTNDNNKPVLEIESARTWHSMFGAAGGGTLATMKNMKTDVMHMFFSKNPGNNNNQRQLRKVPLVIFDPLVLTHPETVRFNPDYEELRNRMAWSEWLNCLPFPHTIFQQGVSIPFFMAVANAKVVHASAVALGYGPKFTYMERYVPLGFQRTIGFGLFSTIPSLLTLIFLGICFLVVKLPVLGDFILKTFAPPGTGASDALCAKGYAEVYAEVKAPLPTTTEDNKDEEPRVACANCFLQFQGDPGNWVTAQCVTESAMALVFNRKELPKRSKDGFGTPAELLGPVLLRRLQDTKVRPVTVKTHVRLNERDHEYKLYM